MRLRFKKKNNNVSRKYFTRGFTLIEMMVSTSIFIMVMVVAAGAILSITTANRKSQATKVAIDNLSFALESMSRHIRVGTSYSCSNNSGYPHDCPFPDGEEVFSFLFADPASLGNSNQMTYSLEETNGVGRIEVFDDNNDKPSGSLTGSDIDVDTLTFYVDGLESGGVQPRVIIVVEGTAGGSDTKSRTSFNLQTSVTQRLLDF